MRLTAEVRRVTNESFHSSCTTVDDFLRFSTELQVDRAELEPLLQRSQTGHKLLIEDPRQRQPSREWRRTLQGWDVNVKSGFGLDTIHSEVLQL